MLHVLPEARAVDRDTPRQRAREVVILIGCADLADVREAPRIDVSKLGSRRLAHAYASPFERYSPAVARLLYFIAGTRVAPLPHPRTSTSLERAAVCPLSLSVTVTVMR